MDCASLFLSGFEAGLRTEHGTQFLLEGLVTVAVAGIAYFTMHDVCVFSPLPFHFTPYVSIFDILGWDG
jgi:hypothetical protein